MDWVPIVTGFAAEHGDVAIFFRMEPELLASRIMGTKEQRHDLQFRGYKSI